VIALATAAAAWAANQTSDIQQPSQLDAPAAAVASADELMAVRIVSTTTLLTVQLTQSQNSPDQATPSQLAAIHQQAKQLQREFRANPRLAGRQDMQPVPEVLRLVLEGSQHAAASAPAPSHNAPAGPRAAASTSSANSTDGCSKSSAKPVVPQLLAALQQVWTDRLSEKQHAVPQLGASTAQPSSVWVSQRAAQPQPAPKTEHFQGISTSAAAAWVDLLRMTATANVYDEPMAFAGDVTR
jgi:hypothetical protein